MNDERTGKNTYVLVAPLDWGLGHATRCIPVINALLQADYKVVIGAEGKALALLQAEFPNLTYVPLQGYRVKYGRNKWLMVMNIFFQIPKVIQAIWLENQWLRKMVEEHNIAAVISDNRYGLYHPAVFSVFITHQLHIKSFLGRWSEQLLQKMNYFFINRFDECWIPDMATEKNLAGELSHPVKKPAIPTYYIGPLSRFSNINQETASSHLLIMLSGPAPQRTVLEDLLLQQVSHYQQPVLFIRGLPDEDKVPIVANHIQIKNHLPAKELQAAIASASFVISRCGYSTVMDIMALNKKSILLPTPGQTEQEYLARHLLKNQYALCITQKDFHLKSALQIAETFPYQSFTEQRSSRLFELIQQLQSKAARKH